MINYDAELHIHNEHLKQAYDFRSTDNVLDIGCGTGQTTRDAARLASPGGPTAGTVPVRETTPATQATVPHGEDIGSRRR